MAETRTMYLPNTNLDSYYHATLLHGTSDYCTISKMNSNPTGLSASVKKCVTSPSIHPTCKKELFKKTAN